MNFQNPVMQNRGPFQFNLPKPFKGKKEDFEDFTFAFKAYLNLCDPEYGKELKLVEDEIDKEVKEDFFKWDVPVPVSAAQVPVEQMSSSQASKDSPPKETTDNEERMARSANLQYLLITLCEGSAVQVLKRETNTNGYESWRLLVKRYSTPKRSKSLNLLTKIMTATFTGDFETKFTQWEEDIAKYEKETNGRLSEDVKIERIIKGTNPDLSKY